jgi:adenylyltransferase/sulfurtransferase
LAEILIQVPRFLSNLLKGEKEIHLEAATIRGVIETLTQRYGDDVHEKLLDAEGKLKSVLNVYVNGKNIRFTGGLDTTLNSGDKIAVLPAVAGG